MRLLDAALSYAALGWHVFPVQPARSGDPQSGKRPAGWLCPAGKDDATTNPEIIRRWWSAEPLANIGIACRPSGLVVLDVDVGNGKRGGESLAEFDGDLPHTLTARTGGGGLHVIFAAPPGDPVHALALRPGLDLIGNGYVVAPPSAHYTGGNYEWLVQVPPAPMPSVLAAARRPRPQAAAPDIAQALVEGERNVSMFRLGAALRSSGLGEDALLVAMRAENAARFRPPLDDDEVQHVWRSVMKRVAPDRDAAAGEMFAQAMAATVSPASMPARQALTLEEAAEIDRPPVRSYATGMPGLDALIGGSKTRQLEILLAPPGDGKTGFAVEQALALESQLPQIYASTELETDELLARFAGSIAGIKWSTIEGGAVPMAEIRKIVAGRNIRLIGCERLPPDTDQALALLATEVEATIAETGKPPKLWLDYLQDMIRGVPEDGLKRAIGGLATRLRAMAQHYDMPICAISAVPRSYYGLARAQAMRQQDNPRAYMAAAKESGDIDFAAAVILFLDVATGEDAGGERAARVAVAKCRRGRVGFVGARFAGATGKWREDAAALRELEADEKPSERAQERHAGDDQVVLDRVARWEWERDLLGKNALREVCGIGKSRAEAAIERLLASGRLVLIDVTKVDGFGRARAVTVIAEPAKTYRSSASGIAIGG